MNIGKTLGALLFTGSTILYGCGTQYIPKNDTLSQRQLEADEATKKALESISNIYKNVENYIKDAEKELNESKELLKSRLQKIQEEKGE